MTAFQIPANEAFDDFDSLVEAINDWMDRSDLSGAAPQMIALAEDEIRLGVEPYLLETSQSLITDTSGFTPLPNDAKRIVRVLYDGHSVPQRAPNAVDRMTEDTARPWAYSLERGGIRVWPSAAHTVEVLYRPLIERLTNANPTNPLLDEFPSLYFYGAMTFASGYVADDRRAEGVFRPMFEAMLNKVAMYYKKQRQGGPMVARVPFVP